MHTHITYLNIDTPWHINTGSTLKSAHASPIDLSGSSNVSDNGIGSIMFEPSALSNQDIQKVHAADAN